MYILYYGCHTIPTCLPRSAAGKIYHANLPPDFDGNKSWTVVEEDVIPWATCPGNNTTATEGVNNPNYCNPAVSLNLLFLFYTPPRDQNHVSIIHSSPEHMCISMYQIRWRWQCQLLSAHCACWHHGTQSTGINRCRASGVVLL